MISGDLEVGKIYTSADGGLAAHIYRTDTMGAHLVAWGRLLRVPPTMIAKVGQLEYWYIGGEFDPAEPNQMFDLVREVKE